MKSLLLPVLLVTSALAGDAVRFEPRFVVLTATNDPAPQYRWADLGRSARERYNALTWQTKPVKKVAKKAAKKEHVADGEQIAPRTFTVTIEPNGLATQILDNVKVEPKFQLAQALQPWKQDFTTLDYCGAHAMILNLGAGHRWAYVYLQERELKQATLHYSTGGAWQSITDAAFPFEFSVPVPDAATEFAFKIEGTGPAGEKTTSPTGRLAP